jgi:hypothetical protein
VLFGTDWIECLCDLVSPNFNNHEMNPAVFTLRTEPDEKDRVSEIELVHAEIQ